MHGSLGFEPQVLEPQLLTHLHAVFFRRPEIRRQLAVHGKTNEVERDGWAVGQGGLFEVNQFKSMLHALTLNVTRDLWKTLVCALCVF